MSIASIEITANPQLAWEQFSMSVPRDNIVKPVMESRDIGGYWKFNFLFHPDVVSRYLAADFLTNGGMRHVEVYNDKGMKDWEGFINKVIYRPDSGVMEMNLGNVFNRQWTRYNDGTTDAPVRSTKFNDTDSQSRIGIKERVIVAGEVSLTVADQHISQLMDWTSFPSPVLREIRIGGRARPVELEIQCLGYWHTLNWRVYNQTASSGDQDASVIMDAIIDDVGEFVKNKEISDNVTQLEQEFDNDRYAGEIMRSIAATGDGGFNKWIVGMTDDRTFYYKQAAKPVR